MGSLLSIFEERENKIFIVIVLFGLFLRLLPMWLWGINDCVRDECSYVKQAYAFIKGEGIVASNGWLWAPGYSTLLVIHKWLFDSVYWIKYTQVLLSGLVAFGLYRLSTDKRKGLWASSLYMFSPVQIFFAQSLWSETLYGSLLLLCMWIFHHRKNSFWMGFGLGLSILLRGVAVYLVPIIGWFLWRSRQSIWMFCLGLVLVVGPYSVYASYKFSRFIISDRTLGQMMWLGNNDFPPMTFDWGHGAISNFTFERYKEKDSFHCPSRPKKKSQHKKNTWSMEHQDCLIDNGFQWVFDHPTEFLLRIPHRLAQLCTPHSFLTRHIRSGGWRGLPEWIDELIIVLGAFMSLVSMWCGVVGLFLQRKTMNGQLLGSVLLYHIVAIAFLSGLSRYRVPLEPLYILYAGHVLGGGWRELDTISMRYVWAILIFFVPLTLWYFPSGWSWWRSYL